MGFFFGSRSGVAGVVGSGSLCLAGGGRSRRGSGGGVIGSFQLATELLNVLVDGFGGCACGFC